MYNIYIYIYTLYIYTHIIYTYYIYIYIYLLEKARLHSGSFPLEILRSHEKISTSSHDG